MRLTRRQFDLTALTTLCASWLHAPHFPLWLNAAITLLIAVRWLQRRLRPEWGKPPALLRLPLTLALPVAVWLQYGNIFGLDPGSVFAVGMLVLKLAESETARDARAVSTFAMFVLMAALLFEQDLLTTLYVGLGVVPLLLTLRALEYDEPAAPASVPALTRLRASTGAVLANLFAAVPLALLVFLFLPRLAAPLWAAQTAPQGKTGLNDSMSPGNLGQLLLDDTPAFRVSFDTEVPPPAQRYWRGIVLWRYDGLRWSRAGGMPLDTTRQPLRLLSPEIGYEITQEPSQKRWLFALDMPTGNAIGAQRDEDYTLAAPRPIGKLTVYRLRSAPIYSLDGMDSRQQQRGLRLPANVNPRAVALGRQWAQQYDDPKKIVQAALDLIRRDFRYTLTPPPLGRNAMDDFLFETKAGYCEHFSSAFAVLMRAAGVPTRVVLGYQGGYWSDVGGYMVVRQSDAHAWNEVWLPDRGWVRIDPTAAVRPDRVELGAGTTNARGSGWFGREWALAMRNRWDLVNRLWTQVVVQFDELTQRGLLRSVGIDQADWRQLGLAFAICMGLLAALGLWWAMHRDRGGGDALDHAYDRLCARLAGRLGIARTPAEGPADYLRRVLQQQPQARAIVEPLFLRYMQLRYAQSSSEPVSVREFSRAVRHADLRRSRTT
jgi:transglutaminase-like putative cysteine protease